MKNLGKSGVFFVCILCLTLQGCKEVSNVLLPDIVSTDSRWIMRETGHLYIHYRPGSKAEHDISYLADYLEDCAIQVENYLDVRFHNKIIYLIYASIRDKEENAREPGASCYAAPTLETVISVYDPPHDVWAIGCHELVHVVMYWNVGAAVSYLLSEGIAVAVDGYWWGKPLHNNTAGLLDQGSLKSLDTMFNNKLWYPIHNEDEYLYYNQAGSFVKYLVDQYGIQPFKLFYTRAFYRQFQQTFQDIYQFSIDDFYNEWIDFLRKV